MARFDIFANPNKSARHALFVDVQSDFVLLPTRWCIPMYARTDSRRPIHGFQAEIGVSANRYVLDTGNLLAVPVTMLRRRIGQLSSADQLTAESCIEFMLRGY
jgi:hypothetical protein